MMIIGRFLANDQWYWAEGEDLDAVIGEIQAQLEYSGENMELFSPEKLEVWFADRARVTAVYELTR